MKARMAALAILAAAVVTALWLLAGHTAAKPHYFTTHPENIMGTTCTLSVVAPQGRQGLAQQRLEKAEQTLREAESRLSAYLADSEVSQLNRAAAGQGVKLSPQTLAVLRLAQSATRDTDGAFDVTIRPLLELWKQAGKRGRLPSDDELASARELVGPDKLRLEGDTAVKLLDGVTIDLGGIAKKCAIDEAVTELMSDGLTGGYVDVGGDIRFFGVMADGSEWMADIRDPFDTDKMMAKIRVGARAVCTSGNYERFVEIDGRRYSHIVDPRTGRPADAVPSVTVVSPQAAGGVWATALSILGPQGLKRLPPGIEALLIAGTPESRQVHMTPGFAPLIIEGTNLLEGGR
jgi:thiamine biosynthesis lipoprotein